MKKLTIIVPYNGVPTSLEDTLVSILENRPAESEIIVSLNAPYENHYDLQEEEVIFVQNEDASRMFETAVETAVGRAEGSMLHIVPCGSRVKAGWADAAVRLFDDESVTCVIPLLWKMAGEDAGAVLTQGFQFSYTGDLFPVRGEMAIKTHVPHPFGVFFRRKSYVAAGGLDLTFGGTLSVVDLALRTKKNGGKIVATGDSALSVPGEMLYPDGPEKTCRQIKRLFWRWNFVRNPILGLRVLMAKWFSFSGKPSAIYKES